MVLFGKGFRFGLLLQAAIGPVFLLVMNTAMQSGRGAALAVALAATLVDALFVSLAILGLGKLLENPDAQRVLKGFGTVVLAYFGLGMLLGSFGIHIIPGFGNLLQQVAVTNAFLYGLVLTASSPLTILFWTGVFATRLSGGQHSRRDMVLFGAGAVTTTFVCLGLVAVVGGLLAPVMSQEVTRWLNVLVGGLLIGFALRMALRPGASKAARDEAVGAE